MNTEGTAPMNGPKNGMILVTPTITLINTANGSFNNDIPTKHIIPIIIESIILPLMNPPKVLLHRLPNSKISFAFFSENKAMIAFLICAWKISLLLRSF